MIGHTLIGLTDGVFHYMFESQVNESLNISPMSMFPPLVLFSSQSYKDLVCSGFIVYIPIDY